MSIALQAAVSGLQTMQTKIDLIANNIANVGTYGFKKMHLEAADLHYTNLRKAGIVENAEASGRPVGIQLGHGSRVIGTSRDLAQGAITRTGQPFDVAILGSGYLQVLLPNNRIAYTRAGMLKKDPATGQLVTSTGDRLTSDVTIPNTTGDNEVQIAKDGTVFAQVPNSTEIQVFGQLDLFTFPNEKGLEAVGNNMLVETAASGEPLAIDDMTDKIEQFSLESSNVNAVEEMTNLILAQRGFELGLKVIRVQDETLEKVNNN